LINSTLRAKVQEFDLEKKRLVLEKIELQEKLDTMSEQVQRLQEQVNTLEEISFPPEFMERLGTL
jgi:predicted nuclease with TOPRIM domain